MEQNLKTKMVKTMEHDDNHIHDDDFRELWVGAEGPRVHNFGKVDMCTIFLVETLSQKHLIL